MRILHLTKKYPPAIGGDSAVVSNLVNIQKKNSKVFVVTSNIREVKPHDNIIKIGLEEKSARLDQITFKRIISLLVLLIKSFYFLGKIRPDIIHSHSPDMGFVISWASRFYKIPIIHTCHGVSFNSKEFSTFKKTLEIFFLKNSAFSTIITVDPSSIDSFNKLNFNNVLYIPNGINLKTFKYKKRAISNPPIIIFIGRLELQKGLRYLIRSVHKLQNNNYKYKLIIIGDGSQKKNLQKEIYHNKINNIVFIDSLTEENLLKYLYTGDILMLPSVWEGTPVTLLEAWATGLPTIVSRVGGMNIIAKDGYNVLKIKPKDSEDIYNKIIELMSNRQLRENITYNARKTVETHHDWESISLQTQQLYENAINKT